MPAEDSREYQKQLAKGGTGGKDPEVAYQELLAVLKASPQATVVEVSAAAGRAVAVGVHLCGEGIKLREPEPGGRRGLGALPSALRARLVVRRPPPSHPSRSRRHPSNVRSRLAPGAQAADRYILAEFRDKTFGTIDDVEFLFSTATPGIVNYRSAARAGGGDDKRHRERVKELRKALQPKGWRSVGRLNL